MIKQESNEQYHAEKEHISSSKLKMYKKSPAYANEFVFPEKDCFDFGSAYHTFILEPGKFHTEYYIFDESQRPEKDKTMASNKNKAWKSDLKAKYKLVSIEDLEIMKTMRRKLFSSKIAKKLLTEGVSEQSIYQELDEVKVKCRADHMLRGERSVITDLKAMDKAEYDRFKWSAVDYGYHISAALYTDIAEKEFNCEFDFYIIAQEKTIPYDFNIFFCSEQFISIGRYEYEEYLKIHKHCTENNHWPGYEIWCNNKYGIQELNIPPSRIKELKYYL